MSKVTLSGHIEVPAVELATITVALEKHMALTREEPGCIVFEVVQDSEEPTMFSVYEEFVDQAAFDSHQNRVLASSWSEATKNVVRHYKVTVEESI
jgi:quinol monooxygenase YgiN